ncbi:TetR family transcriptional regulator [Desulfobotulus sp. H1]|uniref:TetR family transcriptional regulator n=1 Tax=Desulfobotulus pelophilus TaxID=2823377 RepID=A0ABT3N563_9BACT|nr:TetR family transcriptional regulator [Desulfobotulus pelophilus]MCW7752598.1 TetR family transcriptional regulator [Desulfobotulus pelophilus]
MEKKEKIIAAAIDVFRGKGIEKTKVSDIVKAAGIAQGTFYLYFPSKLSVMPDIASVMVQRTVAEVRERVREEGSFWTRMEELVDVVFRLTEEYRDVLALIYAGLSQTRHITEWETIYAPFYEWMGLFLRQAQNNGEIRSTLNADRTAKLLIGLIESTAEQIYLYDALPEKEKVAFQQRELMDFMRYGLICEESKRA